MHLFEVSFCQIYIPPNYNFEAVGLYLQEHVANWCWASPDMEARLVTDGANYLVRMLGGELGQQWRPSHQRPLSHLCPGMRLGSRTTSMKMFCIDFFSVCGCKEALVTHVGVSNPGKTVSPASPITTSKFLIIINHLLTQNGNGHIPGPRLESDRLTWDFSFGSLPKVICCKNSVQLFTSLDVSFLIFKMGMAIFSMWELLRRGSMVLYF